MPDLELASFQETHAAGKGRTLVGYASAFNTDVVGPYDQVTRFQEGAWTKTLREHSDDVVVLFNHGKDPTLGLKPLGKPQVMAQDSYGLWTETPLDKTSWNDDILESLRSGALKAMSVTFEPLDVTLSDDRTVRTITTARLWEFGPVTFPANPGATATLHDLESLGVVSSRAESDEGDGRGDPPPLTLERLTWHIRTVNFEDEMATAILEDSARLERLT